MNILIKTFQFIMKLSLICIFLLHFTANASHIKCSDYDGGYLTDDTVFIGESDCELGDTGNDTGNGNTVVGMFGITDWDLIEEGVDISSGISPNDFTINPNYFDDYNVFMLTFKSSNANSGVMPDVFIAYLLEPTSIFDIYNWFDQTMFKKLGGGFHAISHMNLYGFYDENVDIVCTSEIPCPEVPEPNTLFMFGLGLVGLYVRHKTLKQ